MNRLKLLLPVVMVYAALGLWSCGTATIPPPAADTPLEPCPESPNCIRSTLEVLEEAETILTAARETLEAMGAESINVSDSGEIHAVFRIAVFGFRDDVHVALTAHPENGTFVHFRSASRTGYSDLGVNARRADRFFRLLTGSLRE